MWSRPLLILALGLVFGNEPIRIAVRPRMLFAGQSINIQIHVRYEEGDRWIRLEFDPDTVGNSAWTITPQDRATWFLQRQIEEPGSYQVRALVGQGDRVRAVSMQPLEVLGY